MPFKLSIELIPASSKYRSVKDNVSSNIWELIRKKSYQKSKYRCKVCGAFGEMKCQEIWRFNDVRHVQTLVGFMALCPDCHLVKHMEWACKQDKRRECAEHLASVNNIMYSMAEDYITRAFYIKACRSNYDWKVNVSYINKFLYGSSKKIK
jgi:hypothetical protein